MEKEMYHTKQSNFSSLQAWRQQYKPTLPGIFDNLGKLTTVKKQIEIDPHIKNLFPSLLSLTSDYLEITEKDNPQDNPDVIISPLRVGVVLSGGQAAGGHNVIAGLYDFIKSVHPSSQLFGFLNGPIGIYTGKYVEINDVMMDTYRNQGGFDIICSGRHKIETPEQFEDSMKYCQSLLLDGLIVIGGDDSNTNACLLAEYFAKHKCLTKVIGAPKTIDGDLKNEYIEVSFGFDTATKVYSEMIGNICLDTLSSKKYYHFIRLMGRSASHISLECGLLTQANLVLVGEEVNHKNQTLLEVTQEITEMIIKRHDLDQDYGVILVPEGLIEFIPEINTLIKEINEILSKVENLSTDELFSLLNEKLTEKAKKVFNFLPKSIANQLLIDRDPHGNVQVSKIDTERLLILTVQEELDKYNSTSPNRKIKFSPQSHFFGYEGRCALPSVFDSEYCYSLGFNAGFLVHQGVTGYMSIIRGLKELNPRSWVPAGCPLMIMMNVERRKGKDVPVIKKALVELDGDMMNAYSAVREIWKYNDSYCSPGPIQYEGEASKQSPYLVYTPTVDQINLDKYLIPKESKTSPFAPKTIINQNILSKFLIDQPAVLPNVLNHRHLSVRLSKKILEPLSEELLASLNKDIPCLTKDVDTTSLAEVVFESEENQITNLKIGIVYNGRQAPGGNNIVKGMLEFKKRFTSTTNNVQLFGFKNGSTGFLSENVIEITEENFKLYNNHGGFDYLGRSVDKIRSSSELKTAASVCSKLDLDGLLIVGASHSLSDAALITEHFIREKIKTKVIGIPCTVDGNISHQMFEASIGFDTASKVYSQLIGNIMTDAASATKYWYFIRLMGRNPSHLVLECALQTHPNYVIISEEVAKNGHTLNHVVSDICDVICERAKQKKNFGTVLIPEGLISYLPYFKGLIDELNRLLTSNTEIDIKRLVESADVNCEYLKTKLTPWSSALFVDLPPFFRKQLLTERESSGNIQLSQIETERLISYMVGKELEKRKAEKSYTGSFGQITHFFGYQGRCSHPSYFDANLATSYGFTACLLIRKGITGFCVTAKGLSGPIEDWILGGIPLTSMMSLKFSSTYGESKSHIASSDVSTESKAFLELRRARKSWVSNESYRNPGPIQFFDFDKSLVNKSIQLNFSNYKGLIDKIEEQCNKIRLTSRFGVREELLQSICIQLESMEKILSIVKKNK